MTPRLLVIDNYDSFTYNLVQMFGASGVELIVWRNDAFDPNDVAGAGVDGIVVSPGPCTPAEAGHSVEVIRRYGAPFRRSASAWVTRRSARPTGDRSSGRDRSCTARPAASRTTEAPCSPACPTSSRSPATTR